MELRGEWVSLYDVNWQCVTNKYFKKLPLSFVPNSVGYVSAKYYVNLFIDGKIIAKIKR